MTCRGRRNGAATSGRVNVSARMVGTAICKAGKSVTRNERALALTNGSKQTAARLVGIGGQPAVGDGEGGGGGGRREAKPGAQGG